MTKILALNFKWSKRKILEKFCETLLSLSWMVVVTMTGQIKRSIKSFPELRIKIVNVQKSIFNLTREDAFLEKHSLSCIWQNNSVIFNLTREDAFLEKHSLSCIWQNNSVIFNLTREDTFLEKHSLSCIWQNNSVILLYSLFNVTTKMWNKIVYRGLFKVLSNIYDGVPLRLVVKYYHKNPRHRCLTGSTFCCIESKCR